MGGEKCLGFVVVSRAAEVADRPDRAVIDESEDRANIAPATGSPGEPGVELENSVELPASKKYAHQIVAASIYRQVPNTVRPEIVGGIVVRRSTFSVIVNWVGLVGDETGAFRRS